MNQIKKRYRPHSEWYGKEYVKQAVEKMENAKKLLDQRMLPNGYWMCSQCIQKNHDLKHDDEGYINEPNYSTYLAPSGLIECPVHGIEWSEFDYGPN